MDGMGDSGEDGTNLAFFLHLPFSFSLSLSLSFLSFCLHCSLYLYLSSSLLPPFLHSSFSLSHSLSITSSISLRLHFSLFLSLSFPLFSSTLSLPPLPPHLPISPPLSLLSSGQADRRVPQGNTHAAAPPCVPLQMKDRRPCLPTSQRGLVPSQHGDLPVPFQMSLTYPRSPSNPYLTFQVPTHHHP